MLQTCLSMALVFRICFFVVIILLRSYYLDNLTLLLDYKWKFRADTWRLFMLSFQFQKRSDHTQKQLSVAWERILREFASWIILISWQNSDLGSRMFFFFPFLAKIWGLYSHKIAFIKKFCSLTILQTDNLIANMIFPCALWIITPNNTHLG